MGQGVVELRHQGSAARCHTQRDPLVEGKVIEQIV